MAQIVIDFGNYDTRVTLRRSNRGGRRPLRGIAREAQVAQGTLAVPSLIHLGDPVELGEAVLRCGHYDAPATFRDLKDYVLHPTDVPRQIDGHHTTYKQAASEFLQRLVARLRQDLDETLDVALIASGNGDSNCRPWLERLELAGVRSISILDEDTALALGHELDPFDAAPVLALDFGFSSIRTRLLRLRHPGQHGLRAPTVLAAAAVPYGMADLKLAALCQLQLHRPGARASLADGAHPLLYDTDLDWLQHDKFQRMLDNQDVTQHVRQALDRLGDQAARINLDLDDAGHVLLVGGGSSLAAVQRLVQERFGERVHCDPLGLACGRGGLAALGEHHPDDMVHSSYSVRMRDPVSGEYVYPVIVAPYTRYPTRRPTASYVVNTFYDGQKALNLEVFKTPPRGRAELREALFAADRRLSIVTATDRCVPEPAMAAPVVIPVNPPGRCGERRFHLEFNVDQQKHLRVSVRDLRAQKTVMDGADLVGLA